MNQLSVKHQTIALEKVPSTIRENPPSLPQRGRPTESVPKSPKIIPPVKPKNKQK